MEDLNGALAMANQAAMNFAVSNRNYKTNKKLLQQQYKYQTEAANVAWQRQMEFYNANNAYNSPSAVRKRYEDAGINPNAAFGTAGSYTPAQAPQSVQPAGSVQAPYVEGSGFSFRDPLDQLLKLSQIANIDASTKKTQGDTVEPGIVSEGVKLTNSLKSKQIISEQLGIDQQAFDLDFAKATREQNISKLDQSVRNMQQQFQVMSAQYETLMDQHRNNPEVVKEIQSRVWMNAAHVALMQAQADLAREGKFLTQAQIENLAQQTSNLESTKALIEKQIQTEGEKPALLRAQKYLNRMQGFKSYQDARGGKRREDAYGSSAGRFITEMGEIIKALSPLK